MKLSVLITYHNEGPWLTECLESLVAQLESDDQVIIYDDASDLLARRHLVNDPRVRVIWGASNIGPARARNKLFGASIGTHIHFHDADDLFAPEWRERVAAAFAQTTPDVVFTDVASFDAQGNKTSRVMRITQLQKEPDLLKFALRGSMLAPCGTYTRELVQRVGGYREDLWQSEDYDFHIRVALADPKFTVIDSDLVLVRRHSKQRSRLAHEVWNGAIDSLDQLAPRIPSAAYTHAAHAATRAGSALFECGARNEATRAFALAERFGGARYERRTMQRLTRLLGAPTAEKLAAWYRSVVPMAVRSKLQRLR